MILPFLSLCLAVPLCKFMTQTRIHTVPVVEELLTCICGFCNLDMFRTHPSVCSIQVLLQLAKGIFEDQSNLDVCVHNIMSESLELLDVERCMVFLIDDSCKGVSIFIEAPSPPVFVFEVSLFVNIKEEILVNSCKFSVPLFPWEGRQGS